MPTAHVLDSTMSYLDQGSGTPIVFLHGNPTSSYVWRKVLRRIGGSGRLLAPDLIGMGESGKPPLEYRFADHARYLDAWFDALGLHGVVLVGHDWGGALAFDWATRHPDRVIGVAFMETIIKPMSWEEFPDGGRDRFRKLRTPGVGEHLVLDRNIFIEDALQRTILSGLDSEDHDVYRKPTRSRPGRCNTGSSGARWLGRIGDQRCHGPYDRRNRFHVIRSSSGPLAVSCSMPSVVSSASRTSSSPAP
jgi:haloalkane dehalogenase